METKKNQGFSLIELLIAMSIMAVVGIMITSLFGSASRLYRASASYSNIQTESQTVSRRIGNVIMSADSLYMDSQAQGTYLFTGETKAEAGKIIYTGTIFWYNKETGCLYQNSGFQAETDTAETGAAKTDAAETGADGNVEENGILSLDTVKNAMEGSDTEGREYLISDKVKALNFTIFPELTEDERIRDGESFYKTDEKISVNFDITFQYLDGKEYSINTSAAPRNQIGVLWWEDGKASVGDGNRSGKERVGEDSTEADRAAGGRDGSSRT